MKFLFNTFIFFAYLILYENASYSLSDNQIKEICQKKHRKAFCIKDLKDKRFNLLKGNQIEIPTIPFKK